MCRIQAGSICLLTKRCGSRPVSDNGPRVSDVDGEIKVAENAILKLDLPPGNFIMEELEFRDHADRALTDLHHRLGKASEEFDFESDFNAGALAIEFEDPPAKFVVSPNTPVRQVWVSAHSRSYKLDWDASRREFVLAGTGQSLAQLIAAAIGQQIGEEVTL